MHGSNDPEAPKGKKAEDYGQNPSKDTGHHNPQDSVAHHAKAHAIAQGAINSHKANDYNAPTTSHDVGHPSTSQGNQGAPKAAMDHGGKGKKPV